MKSKTRRIILAVAVIGVLAAGGAAFTSSSSLPNTVAGYATSTITGADANRLSYDYTTVAAVTSITGVDMVFNQDLTGATGTSTNGQDAIISSAFNLNPLVANCAIVGGYDGAATPSVVPGTGTHVHCDYSTASPPTQSAPQLLDGIPGTGADTFNVSVVTAP